MIRPAAVRDALRMLHLAAKLLAGRFYPAVPAFVLVWPALMWLFLLAGNPPNGYRPPQALSWLIGLPLGMFGAALGVRVIAGEIDRRTLEIAYTIPGGAWRLFAWKLVAGLPLILWAEALLAAAAFLLFTDFPAGALYGAFQIGYFYLVVGMAAGALAKSEITGAMIAFGAVYLGWLAGWLRISPFFDPTVWTDRDDATRLAWAVQNRLGMLLAAVALTALAFGRAERRERLLS